MARLHNRILSSRGYQTIFHVLFDLSDPLQLLLPQLLEWQHLQWVEALERTKARAVKGNHKGHYFAQVQSEVAAFLSQHRGQLDLLLPELLKLLAKVIHIAKDLCHIQVRYN